MADKKPIDHKPIQGIKKRINMYKQSGQWEKVAFEYKRLTDFEPMNPEPHQHAGDAYYRASQGLTAVTEYLTAAKLYEDNLEYEKTIAVLKKVMKIKPSMVDINIRLGDLYAKEGKTSDAIEHYQEVSRYYTEGGSHEEALAVNKKIIDLQPDNLIIHRKLAEMLEQMGRTVQAIVEYKSLAKKVVKKGLDNEALNLLKKIIALDPSSIEQMFELIQLYFRTGQLDLASEVIRTVLLNNPSSAKAYLLLGNVCVEKGEQERALKAYLKSNSIKPNQETTLRKITQLQIDSGNIGLALEEANNLVEILLKSDDEPAAREVMNYFHEARITDSSHLEQYITLLFKVRATDNIQSVVGKLLEMYVNSGNQEQVDKLQPLLAEKNNLVQLQHFFIGFKDIQPDTIVYELLGDMAGPTTEEKGVPADSVASEEQVGSKTPTRSIADAIIPKNLKASGQRQKAKQFEVSSELDINIGKALYNMGLFKEAIREFSRLLSSPESVSRANAWIGICQKELGQLKLAEEYFKRVTDPEVREKIEKYDLYKYD